MNKRKQSDLLNGLPSLLLGICHNHDCGAGAGGIFSSEPGLDLENFPGSRVGDAAVQGFPDSRNLGREQDHL